MHRHFVTLDVFTNRRFAGNPLAVVLDAEGLDPVAMQARKLVSASIGGDAVIMTEGTIEA